MAMIRCAECENFVDDDYDPCEEFNSELVCPDCYVLLAEISESVTTEGC